MWFKNGLKAQKLLAQGIALGNVGNQQGALKGQKLYVLSGVFKAFALSGRQVCVRNYPGRCPGLGASALSGRMGLTFRACGAYFQGVWSLLFLISLQEIVLHFKSRNSYNKLTLEGICIVCCMHSLPGCFFMVHPEIR